MFFNFNNQFRKFQNLLVGQFLLLAFFLGNVLPLISAVFGFSVNASFLNGNILIYYSSGIFLYYIRVGSDLAGNNGFAEP